MQANKEDLYLSILENTLDAIVVMDVGYNIIFLSKTIQAFYLRVWELEIKIGDDFRNFISKERKEGFLNAFSKAMNGETVIVETESKVQGGLIWVEHKINPLYATSNDFLGICMSSRNLDARKRAEIALRKSEEEFRLLTEYSSDMISRHTKDGVYTYASAACESILGYTPNELIGKSSFDFISSEDFHLVEESRKSILKKKGISTLTYRIKRKDGKLIWLETTSHCINDPTNGHILEIHATSRDVTERKWAEEALKESEAKYTKIFDKAPVFISIIDSETGKYVEVNQSALDFSGYEREEVIGRSATEIGWTSLESRQLLLERLAKYNRIEGLEMAFTTKKGDIVYCIVNAERVTFGGRDYVLAISPDITERKRAEQLLRESEALYSNIFEHSPIGLQFYNTDGFLMKMNNACIEIFGILDAFDTKSWNLFKDPFITDAHKEELRRGNTIKFVLDVDLDMVRKRNPYRSEKSGIQVLDVIISPMEIGFITQIKDITESKRTELELTKYRNKLELLVKEKTEEIEATNEEIRATNDVLFQKNEIIQLQNEELQDALNHLKNTQSQLFQAEKLASLGVLTAGVAHEINNPLNYILGAYEGLSVVLDEETKRKSEHIPVLLNSLKEGVDRVSKIVKGLNQFSRVTESNDEKCDIQQIMDNCLVILHKQYKDRITINKTYPEKSVTIVGNVGKLHQAFTNILVNAIQAIDNNGTIDIILKREEGNVIVEIIDTGSGISKENLPKITEPFFTTKAPRKGTGLGLSITHSIINEFKGTIKFSSELNKGTSVMFTFPIGN